MPDLILDENHVYHRDGLIVPGTTTILHEFVKIELYGEAYYVSTRNGACIRGDYFEAAQRFGRAIHKASYYLLTGQGLAYDRIHPDLVPTLNQLETWIERYKPKAELCEKPLYSRRYHYAGTPDFFGTINGYRTGKDLIDLKTGMFEMAEAQTASYEQLVREETGYKGMIRRWVLHLPKDGSPYRFIPMMRKDAFRYFLGELSNYNWRMAT